MARCTSLSEPYDRSLSHLLLAYIATGIFFMLLPGTFFGVMNLLTISAKHASSAADPAGIQAHGHAQIFGWLGTFILGVGFYTIPRLRLTSNPIRIAWAVWSLWTAGVALRWAVGITQWQWRVLFPLAAAMELAAAVVFFLTVFLPRPRVKQQNWRSSLLMIELATVGMIAVLAVNLYESLRTLVFPYAFNQRFLTGVTWAFIVPFIWGYGTRWIPPLLGLRKSFKPLMLPSVGLLFAGAAINSAAVIGAACVMYVIALRIFEPPLKPAKLRGVHPSVGTFLRIAFAWMLIAAALAFTATFQGGGFTGAARHALTVGFMVATVFCIGSRVLPAFFGVRRLFSTRVMFASLLMINIGCTLRVGSQVLAYGHTASAAWAWLPVSGILEITAILLFAFNMIASLTTGTPYDTYLDSLREARPVLR